jgi:hypothetical protein
MKHKFIFHCQLNQEENQLNEILKGLTSLGLTEWDNSYYPNKKTKVYVSEDIYDAKQEEPCHSLTIATNNFSAKNVEDTFEKLSREIGHKNLITLTEIQNILIYDQDSESMNNTIKTARNNIIKKRITEKLKKDKKNENSI